MRKLYLLAFLLLSAIPVKAQNPSVLQANCSFGFTATTTGRSTSYQNVTPVGVSTKGCTNWTLVYSSTGFSAVSIEVDSAPDTGTTVGVAPGSWTVWPSTQIAAGQAFPATLATSSGITFFGFFPWVSINVTSVTGTGQIVAYVYGWQTSASQESNTGATSVQGVAANGLVPNGNSIQTALNAPTKPWDCSLTGLVATLTQCQAAPAAGTRLYITDITVVTTTATAGTYQIRYGTGANCATGTVNLYPSFTGTWIAPVTGAPQKINFTVPLQPAAANAVCVIGTATNTVNIELEGFIAP
jgi:hypothetical protein